MHTVQIIIASTIIVAIVIAMFGLAFSRLFGPTVPSPIADVSLNLDLICGVETLHTQTYYTSYITSLRTNLDISVKNQNGFDITVDRIVPISENATLYGVTVPLNVEAYQYRYWYIPVNWANVTAPKVLVVPGDVFTFKYGILEKEQNGAIVTYSGSLPTAQPDKPSYTCPFIGNSFYSVTVQGDIMKSIIETPGCAPLALVTTNNIYAAKILVLGSMKVLEYYYKDYDIPFYVHLYSTNDAWGFYWRGDQNTYGFGLINLFRSTPFQAPEVIPQMRNPSYFAYWLDSTNGKVELYVDNNVSPSLTSTGSINPVTTLVIGLSRAKPARGEAPPIYFYNYMYSTSPQYITTIDYSNGYFNITNANTGKVVVGGPFYVFSEGSDVETYLRSYGVVAVKNSNPNVTRYIDIYAGTDSYQPYRLHRFYAPALPGALLDLIVAWEDLVGPYPPGSPSVNANGDEWLRVTYFPNGTWRIGIYVASGGYKHAFYIGDKLVYEKPYNTGWMNAQCSSQGSYCIYYESRNPIYVYYPWKQTPLSSEVPYIGIFKDRTITVKGLYPGDKLILSIPTGKVVTIEAESDVVIVDLLQYFGPYDLVNALKIGGILLTIQPSLQRIISLIPSKAYVHVVSRTADTWIEVPVLIRPSISCVLTYGLTTPGTLIVERKGELYKLTMLPQSSTSHPIGVFPRVEISLQTWWNFKITITYMDGSMKVLTPDNISSYRLGILLVTDKAVLQMGTQITEDDKPFSKIVIEGSMDVKAYLAK